MLAKTSGVLLYMDDLIVHGNTADNFLFNLESVLKILNDEGLQPNKEKCCWNKKKVKWLGHILSKDDSSPDPEKVEAIQRLEIPKNKTDLRRLLGMSGFYERFICNHANLVGPLYGLLKENKKYEVAEKERQAIEGLKRALKKTTVLIFFILVKEF